MKEGVYRAGGTAGGLPLPRRNLRRLSAAIVVAACNACLLPLFLFLVLEQWPASRLQHFKQGGLWMFIVLSLNIGAALVLGFLGLFVLRGKRVPGPALAAVAAAPLANAMTGAFTRLGEVMDRLNLEPIELTQPLMKHEMVLDGISETMAIDILGALATGFLALVVAIACVSSVASIDRPKAPNRRVLVSGALWLFATLGLALPGSWRAFLPAVAIAVLLPLVIMAARRVHALGDWHDPAEATRAMDLFVIGGIAMIVAVGSLEYAVHTSAFARALWEVTVHDVNGAERVAILGALASDVRLGRLALAAHVVLGGLTFACALAPARARPTRATIASAILAALLLLGGFALSRVRIHAPTQVENDLGYGAPALMLPNIRAPFGDSLTYSREFPQFPYAVPDEPLLCRNGRLDAKIFARRDLTIAMLREATPDPKDCALNVTFVANRTDPPAQADELGELAPLLGGLAFFSGRIIERRDLPTVGIVVRVSSNGAFAVQETDPAGRRIDAIRYDYQPSETIEHALGVIVAVESERRSRIVPRSLARSFTCTQCER